MWMPLLELLLMLAVVVHVCAHGVGGHLVAGGVDGE
jgi:hypothetical protein